MTAVIPSLPCPSIDEVPEFYSAQGFERTHRQSKPNPYRGLLRTPSWPSPRSGPLGIVPSPGRSKASVGTDEDIAGSGIGLRAQLGARGGIRVHRGRSEFGHALSARTARPATRSRAPGRTR